MNKRLIRGSVLSFREFPRTDAEDCFDFIEGGDNLICAGRIEVVGAYPAVAPLAAGAPEAGHRPHLIMAGLIDLHIHFPQVHVIGSVGAQLLDWLKTYTFGEEQRFEDGDHSNRMTSAFFDALIRRCTKTVAAFRSVHLSSAEAFFTEVSKRDMAVAGGKS